MVEIFKTEQRQYGDLNCKIYWLSTEKNGLIAVTRTVQPTAIKANIVFLPGMFSNRRFWLSDKGIGLASYLHKQGYECWMIDRRGLGESSKNDYKTANLHHCMEYDLPAVQRLIENETQLAAFWFGHSFGGVVIAKSIALGKLDTDKIAGLVNFSSQLTVDKPFLNPPLSILITVFTRTLGYFPSKKFKMGPENEAPDTMRDCVRLVSSAKTKKKPNFWSGFENVTAPVLSICSEGDSVDPHPGCKELMDNMGSNDKTFALHGKKHGHLQDYNHVSLVISKDAQKEIWPMISNWLEKKL